MKEIIEKNLNELLGMPLWSIGRAGDLEWFHFGKQNVIDAKRTRNGKEKIVGDYALHVQCAWRISYNAEIIVASRDRYYPKGDDPYKDLDDFDWGEPGANRCDDRVDRFLNDTAKNPLIVTATAADEVGGFVITLNNLFRLEIFPDVSFGHEYWRLFHPYDESAHFVVTGNGIED